MLKISKTVVTIDKWLICLKHSPTLKMKANMICPSERVLRNQGNQYSSANKKNVIEGQRLDIENRHTQQRTKSN